jgi:hypothetical protein
LVPLDRVGPELLEKLPQVRGAGVDRDREILRLEPVGIDGAADDALGRGGRRFRRDGLRSRDRRLGGRGGRDRPRAAGERGERERERECEREAADFGGGEAGLHGTKLGGR